MRLTSVLALSAFLAAPMGLALGSAEQTPPEQTETTTTCTDGMIWDAEKKECVAPKESGLSDDILFEAARELAHAGQYGNALNALSAMHEENSARVLNYTGFSHRKAGRLALGMTFYRRTLTQDPDYLLARSYMGQALADQGDLAAARAQLLEIRNRGGRGTWAYESLRLSLSGTGSY